MRREYVGGAAASALVSSISPASTSATITEVGGWPSGAVGPFAIVIDRGTASEEKVLVQTRAAATLTFTTRGYDDTPQMAHDAGATVEVCFTANDLDDANAHIFDNSRDDHPQYHNAARHALVAHDSTMLATGAVTADKLATSAVTTSKIADGSVTQAKLAEGVGGSGSGAWAAGDLKVSARSAPESGWLLCDGAAVVRTTYPDLFNAIGTTFGEGDGINTFNLPDYRGRMIIGAGQGAGLTARTRGMTGGAETHILSAAEMPTHTHSVSSQTSGVQSANHSHSISLTTDTAANHTHGGGSGLQYVVGALSSSTLYLNSGVDADHGAAGADVDVTFTASTAAAGSHSHSVAGSTAGVSADHTHTIPSHNTQNAGSSQAHNNMPPFGVASVFIKI